MFLEVVVNGRQDLQPAMRETVLTVMEKAEVSVPSFDAGAGTLEELSAVLDEEIMGVNPRTGATRHRLSAEAPGRCRFSKLTS